MEYINVLGSDEPSDLRICIEEKSTYRILMPKINCIFLPCFHTNLLIVQIEVTDTYVHFYGAILCMPTQKLIPLS